VGDPGEHEAEELDLEQSSLDRVLDIVDTSAKPAATSSNPPSSLAVVQLVDFQEDGVRIRIPGASSAERANLAPHLQRDFVEYCAKGGYMAMADIQQSPALLVGMLQVGFPPELTLRAAKVEIEGTEALTLKSGRSAVQLRRDGAMELLGTRITATSRGIFRILGRALRLN
jgi:hypothetical protein